MWTHMITLLHSRISSYCRLTVTSCLKWIWSSSPTNVLNVFVPKLSTRYCGNPSKLPSWIPPHADMPISSSENSFLVLRLNGLRDLGPLEETLRERSSVKYVKREENKDFNLEKWEAWCRSVLESEGIQLPITPMQISVRLFLVSAQNKYAK